MADFTTDIIGTCAFGLEINAISSKENQFKKMGFRIFPSNIHLSMRLKILLNQFLPNLSYFYKFRMIDRDIEDFMVKVIKDTVSYREKVGVIRNDFLDLLIQLRNKGKIDSESTVSDNEACSETNTKNLGNVHLIDNSFNLLKNHLYSLLW